MRRDLKLACTALLCAWLCLSTGGRAWATPAVKPSEPAPVEVLGPPSAAAPGARVEPDGVAVTLAPSRRSAEVTARFVVTARPGPLLLTLPSTLFQVAWDAPGGVTPGEITRDAAPAGPAPTDARIDPGDGQVYRRGPAGPARPRFQHTATVMIPAAGRLEVQVSGVVSSGFDRARRPRLGTELAHALHRRPDFFVYQFAVIGPAGPVTIAPLPATTAASSIDERRSASLRAIDDGVVRVAATRARLFPLGLTLGLGVAVGDADGATTDAVAQGVVRAALDGLLPWGHALSLTGELASALQDHHRVSTALLYQIYTRWPTFFPVGAHLDLGPIVDVWATGRPGSVAPGGRVGLGVNLSALGLSGSLDLVAPQGGAPADPPLRYRVSILATVGL